MSAALLKTWTGPARRRRLVYDLIVGLPLVLSTAFLVSRIGGLGWGAAVAAAGLAVGAVVVWRRSKAFDRAWLVRSLDATRPDLEDSADLLFAAPEGLNPLQRLQRQRLEDRLGAGSPKALVPAWPWLKFAAAGLAAVLLTLAGLLWPQAHGGPVRLSPSQEGAAAPAGAPRLVGQNLRIIPPAYTGLPVRDSVSLDARAPQGSRLEWRLRFDPQAEAPRLVMLAGQPTPLRRSGRDWVASRTLDAAFLYRVDPGGDQPPAPLHRIDATPDQPPQVRVVSPNESLTTVSAGQRSWSPVFAATDDYGVAAQARLRITLAMGEGENVTFTEREIGLTGTGSARDRRFSPRLDFAALGFGPGGDLVVQVIVKDTRSPGPHEVRGPSLILRWPSANQAQSSGLEGMVNTTLPAYFRSQRQIIIDAEALIRQRRSLSDDRYLSRSMSIGGDQEILRGRYSQFLGGEIAEAPQLPTSEGEEAHTDGDGHDHGPAPDRSPGFGGPEDVLAQFGHPHDDSPASSLDPETRALLRQAVDAMWRSEEQLKLGRPDLALPHANRALEFIKQVQQATRIFLQRVGPQLPPIDPGRRMTGKRDGLASRALPVAPIEAGDGAAAAAWRALGEGPDAVRGPIAFDALESWIRANAGRLPHALALTAALDEVRRAPDCQACRNRLRAQLWTAMERPPADLSRRRPADARGARYLGALAGGRP